jgi:hypothetical protein
MPPPLRTTIPIARSDTVVWVVAATGDIDMIGNPLIHGTWGVFVLDAQTGAELARDVGQGPSWPRYFDKL